MILAWRARGPGFDSQASQYLFFLLNMLFSGPPQVQCIHLQEFVQDDDRVFVWF